jgi:uncharacterized repeat protein (TIGR03803 family)
MKRMVNAFSKLNQANRACAMLALCAGTAIALPAQTLTLLFNFEASSGTYPAGVLLQAADGDIYGTTSEAGANMGYGTVYRISPNGMLTTLYTFCSQPNFPNCQDGGGPFGGLVQAVNGDLFGTTYQGGTAGRGTIFKITPDGTLTTLYSFCFQAECPDGLGPENGLVQAADGNLYGTTTGIAPVPYSNRDGGTIFKITPSGTLTTLYRFCAQTSFPTNCPNGATPGGLTPASDGYLYGTTYGGVTANNSGTVFKITTAGALATLHLFCSQTNCADGAQPEEGPIQAANGAFYGTTLTGGAHRLGTVFKITADGALTTLYSFCALSPPNCADGAEPEGPLVQANDGDLYGTTQSGGAYDGGTVFKISPDGTLTTLYSFCAQHNCPDGVAPPNGLIQDTNGDFYGTTDGGGRYGFGTIYRLSVGLGPFVKTRPPFGTVGAVIEILGTDLNGATSVSFNGTAAAFTVVSGSHISATVPAGASTGSVQVVTPSGTLSSNAPFRVSQ